MAERVSFLATIQYVNHKTDEARILFEAPATERESTKKLIDLGGECIVKVTVEPSEFQPEG